MATGLSYTSTASAALISRLGGQAVYDTDFNITWLANANANGPMNWDNANAWAAGLNVGGYTGWRLPTTDSDCGESYNCINSEMGHLYYTELGLTQGKNITSSTSPYLALFTNFTFNNDIPAYWTGSAAPSFGSFLQAWVFRLGYAGAGGNFAGQQYTDDQIFWRYAMAVRSGDVGGSSVPEPGILGLVGIGTLAWVATRSRRLG